MIENPTAVSERQQAVDNAQSWARAAEKNVLDSRDAQLSADSGSFGDYGLRADAARERADRLRSLATECREMAVMWATVAQATSRI